MLEKLLLYDNHFNGKAHRLSERSTGSNAGKWGQTIHKTIWNYNS